MKCKATKADGSPCKNPAKDGTEYCGTHNPDAQMGRPEKQVNEALIVKLAEIHCTDEEIAAVCECSSDTLARHYREMIDDARSRGKSSLRRMQFQAAMNGDRTMLVWLGKNYLGQTDKTAHEHTGKGGASIKVSMDDTVDEYAEAATRVIEAAEAATREASSDS